MHRPYHIYIVFNPFLNNESIYETQGHEFYYRLREKCKTGDIDDAYMLWGKLSVQDKLLQHANGMNDIIKTNEQHGFDTHIYISDYHHFWVGKVTRAFDDIEDQEHSLSFYDDKKVAMWFKIVDFDLLSSQFEETMYYLGQLYCDNEYSETKVDELTPYVGNLKFPLIVQDKSEEQYFRATTNYAAQRVLQENFLVERPTLMNTVGKQVKAFVLKPDTYNELGHNMKTQLLSAEAHLLDEKNPKEKFKSVLASYLNILNHVVVNTFGPILQDYYGNCLYYDVDKDTLTDIELKDCKLLSQDYSVLKFYHLIDLFNHSKNFGNISFEMLVNDYPELFNFFSKELVPFVLEFELCSKFKKMLKGDEISISQQEVMQIRNKILGIGNIGFLNILSSLKSK